MHATLIDPSLEPDLDDDIAAIVRGRCRDCRLAIHVEAVAALGDGPLGWTAAYRRVAEWGAAHQLVEIDGTRRRHGGHAVVLDCATSVVCDWRAWIRSAWQIEPGVYLRTVDHD